MRYETAKCVLRHDIYEGMFVRAWMGSGHEERWLDMLRGDKDILEMAQREVADLRGRSEEDVRLWDSISRGLLGDPTEICGVTFDDSTDQEGEGTCERFHKYWHH